MLLFTNKRQTIVGFINNFHNSFAFFTWSCYNICSYSFHLVCVKKKNHAIYADTKVYRLYKITHIWLFEKGKTRPIILAWQGAREKI